MHDLFEGDEVVQVECARVGRIGHCRIEVDDGYRSIESREKLSQFRRDIR